MQKHSWSPTAARLRYLDRASDLLFVSSPSIGARLQAVRRADGEQNQLGTANSHLSSRATPVCEACGTFMIPGWNSEYVHRRGTTKMQKRSTSALRSGEKRSFKRALRCSACNRTTEIEAQKPPRNRLKKEIILQSPTDLSKGIEQGMRASPMSCVEPAAEVTSTKKRTRGKKSNSLQAMLASQKAKASSASSKGLGLDLMDFMKT